MSGLGEALLHNFIYFSQEPLIVDIKFSFNGGDNEAHGSQLLCLRSHSELVSVSQIRLGSATVKSSPQMLVS